MNYCAYGGKFFKKTQLWTGPDGFDLAGNGFEAALCAGKGINGGVRCHLTGLNMLTGLWVHPKWEGTRLEDREAIPFALSRALGCAIASYLSGRAGTRPSGTRECSQGM